MGSEFTRRAFALTLPAMLASAAKAQSAKARKRGAAPVILGVCSTSLGLKEPSIDRLIEELKSTKLSVVSLGEPHFHPWTEAPNRIGDMRATRTALGHAGILIRSVSVEIAASRTDAEISRMLAMANALDIRHVAAEVPMAMLGRVNDLARKHGVIVALRNTPELKSVSEMQTAVQSFGSLGLAVDAGKVEASGSDPNDLLRHNASRIFELRFRAGTPKTAEVLQSVRYEHPLIPLLIDAGSKDEVVKSAAFYRESTRNKPTPDSAPVKKRPGKKD